MSADEQRKLAAIMFTDMVGYSALSQRDEKLAQELLEEHRRLLREIFPRFNGTEIKTFRCRWIYFASSCRGSGRLRRPPNPKSEFRIPKQEHGVGAYLPFPSPSFCSWLAC